MFTLKTLFTSGVKNFSDNVHLVEENVAVEIKRLLPVLSYLRRISFQARTKRQQTLKYNCKIVGN